MRTNDWPLIPQGDVSALPAAERAERLVGFESRLRAWAAGTDGRAPSEGPIISIETSAFKGGWLMPAIESVIGQTSRSWVYTIRWDGGDDLAREVLEIVKALDHPQLRVYFGENVGIAPSNRFLTANSIGDFIIQLDDDDLFAPTLVERFVATVTARPWAGIVRAQRDFIDELGNHVPADPWFPFEPRHYQHGMVTDIHNHCQPALVSRAAYDRTSGWDGFAEYLYAGADCDIFLKIEEVGPIVLLDELLYHYRLSGRRTSLRITDKAAYDMWRRLADRTIARIGLPLERENEQPPFLYRRTPRARASRALVDFVIIPSRPDARVDADALLQKTLLSLQRLGVGDDAVHLCARHADQSPAVNEAIRGTVRPLVGLVRAGIELPSPEELDSLLAVLDDRDADLVSPRVIAPSLTIVSADPAFDDQRQPVHRGAGEEDRGQFNYVGDASWLPLSALIVRREVDRAVGGFDGAAADGRFAAADFCLKARFRDFKCIYVGSVAAVDHGTADVADAEVDRQRFIARWADAAHLLTPIGAAGQPSFDEVWARGQDAISDNRHEEAVAAFQVAIARDPARPQGYEGLGRALGALARWEDAAAAFERAAILQPEEFWHHYQLGNALRHAQRLDEAVIAFERAVVLQPDIAGGHAGLGHTLFTQKRWRNAADAFERAIALDPDGFWSFHQLGSALVRLGMRRDAIAAFERATALDHPEVFWAFYSIGDIYHSMERWEEAAAAYQKAIELRYPVVSTHVQLGFVYVRLGRLTDAAIAYETAVTLDPSHSDAYLSLGDVLSTLSRWEDAIGAYRRSVELKPGVAAAHAGLADVFMRTRQWDAAASSYRHAIAIDSASSDWHHRLGDALLNLQRFEEAAAAFERAGQLNPSWAQRPLGPRVAAAEHWVESLRPVADLATTTGAGRTIFVFDTDYGELTTAMYMLLGQELGARATFLVPSRLFVTNRDILPGRTRHYATVQDVLSAVDAVRPEIVFLCSGYVYSFHEIFALDALEDLVRALRERGCTVVTTDPFLGLLSDLGTTTTVSVDIPENAATELRRLKEVLDERLNRHFSVTTAILRDLPHLYPAYPVASEHAERAVARGISFFNPRLVHESRPGEPDFLDDNADPFWLFILASRDYEVQTMFLGKDAFTDLVARKIEQAQQAGRHAVFIGPYECVQALIRHMSAAGRWSVLEGVTLTTFCAFPRFSALLLTAEYVFYWNALSHSMFLRLVNGRPVFLFDRGHLVRNVTPLYERIVEWYYQGWDPIYVDPEQDLRAAPLGELAERYRAGAREVTSRLRRSPLPEAMIEQLLRDGKGVGVDD